MGIGLPVTVRRSLATLQQELEQTQADVKWVEERHLHVTLKFLGEITEEERRAIEAIWQRVAAHEAPFTMSLEEIGAFPSTAAPRVILVGIKTGREAVVRMAEACERETAAIPLRQEERPFVAHVTLGRVRSPRHRQPLAEILRTTAWQPPAPWRVDSLTLYQSVLGPGGPAYRVLADIPLSR